MSPAAEVVEIDLAPGWFQAPPLFSGFSWYIIDSKQDSYLSSGCGSLKIQEFHTFSG